MSNLDVFILWVVGILVSVIVTRKENREGTLSNCFWGSDWRTKTSEIYINSLSWFVVFMFAVAHITCKLKDKPKPKIIKKIKAWYEGESNDN